MGADFAIAGREISAGAPPYLVAELSGNHNGDITRAFRLIEAAKHAGADAVKLQTYTADTITIECDRPEFRIDEGLWKGRTLHELYREAETPWEWHEALFAKGRELGITVFSAPFDPTAVELLQRLHAPAYKIASFEIVDHDLVAKAASTGKPLIISTGMADADEIGEAIEVARRASAGAIALLHCVSAYPAPPEDANLRTIAHLASRFGVPVGLSDHTLGTDIALAAVAMGAVIIEKHLTLRRADGGPDAAFSLEPEELAVLVEGCRRAYASLGAPCVTRPSSEQPNLRFRRSLYAVADVPAGALLTRGNVRSIRPGHGLAPKHLDRVLGRRATRAIARGTPLDWSLIG